MRERGDSDSEEIRNRKGDTAKEFIDKLADEGKLPPEVTESAARAADQLAKLVDIAEKLIANPENPELNRSYADALSRVVDGKKQDVMNILGAGIMAVVVLNKFGGDPKFKL